MLQLLSIGTDKADRDPKNATDTKPVKWKALYQITTQKDRDSEYPGASFWFETTVIKDSSGYRASLEIEAPVRGTLRDALMKLAEWAQMAAQGIEECDLPDAGFPLDLPRRIPTPQDAFQSPTPTV